MNRATLSRLARMGTAEVCWRARALTRTGWDRLRTSIVPPAWDRTQLGPRLAPTPSLNAAREALARNKWDDAHRELTRHFTSVPQRFVVAPANRALVAARIREDHPQAVQDAAARANRLLRGEYDLLGYRALRFDRADAAVPSPCGVDWQFDPVHGKRPPRTFWSAVPYLDPACGDHKIIWELNRHQHWIALGRAHVLTGEARYRDRCLDEMYGWLGDNPPLTGINWASMLELGLRSISWTWALSLFVDTTADDSRPWTVDLLLGLDAQLTHVERNLSFYFSPNTHLLGEALALYVVGRAVPELKASARRAQLGRTVLVDEIGRQIAGDGGHREGSTHYHRYTLDFFLLALAVARITNDPVADRFADAVARLASAARLLADDFGRLPSIGDDDGGALWPVFGRAPNDISDSLTIAGTLLDRPELRVGAAPEEACWIAAERGATVPPSRPAGRDSSVPVASSALAETGYYVSRSPAGDHIVIDGGPHGYQNGGHAHADALSLTMTLDGNPLLIDPGTGCYTIDLDLRERLRSSAFHNTLLLDGRSQSQPNGPFHWSHTANSRTLCWQTTAAFDYFVGSHDGYRPVEHRRHVLILHGDLLLVADFVGGDRSHQAELYWHIDPRWSVHVDDRRLDLSCGARSCQLVTPAPHAIELFMGDRASGLGWHAPVYGQLQPAKTLRIASTYTAPFWMITVFGFDPQNQVLDAQLDAAGTADSTTATGVRIVRRASIDEVVVSDSVLTFVRTGSQQRSNSMVASFHTDSVCAA